MATAYSLEEKTIDVYFQKSQKFLYPLVGVGCKSIMPTQTFVAWDHFSKLDFRLIAVFDQQTSCSEDDIKDFQYFSEHFLKPNKFFQENFLLEAQKEIFVFNLEEYSEDWIHFLRGKYSLFSQKAKKKILRYYASDSLIVQYMESYLYPSKFFDLYAQLLNVDAALLEVVGELCDQIDIEREELKLSCEAVMS